MEALAGYNSYFVGMQRISYRPESFMLRLMLLPRWVKEDFSFHLSGLSEDMTKIQRRFWQGRALQGMTRADAHCRSRSLSGAQVI